MYCHCSFWCTVTTSNPTALEGYPRFKPIARQFNHPCVQQQEQFDHPRVQSMSLPLPINMQYSFSNVFALYLYITNVHIIFLTSKKKKYMYHYNYYIEVCDIYLYITNVHFIFTSKKIIISKCAIAVSVHYLHYHYIKLYACCMMIFTCLQQPYYCNVSSMQAILFVNHIM